MRRALLVLFSLALWSVAGLGQVILDSANAVLSTASTTTVTSIGGGTGTLKSISCLVGGASITGSVSAGLRVTLDGVHTTTYTLYSASNQWPASLAAFVMQGAASPGPNTGDTFILPLNVDYTSGLTVDVHVTSAGSSGNMVCSALHT